MNITRSAERLKRGLTPDLERLSPRQRAMVEAICANAGATLREIYKWIPDPPASICGLRTQLNRLVKRGVLTARRSGRHSEMLYLPAGSWPELQRRALERIAIEHFEGSILDAVYELMRLATYESPRTWSADQRPHACVSLESHNLPNSPESALAKYCESQ